jgi:predicted NBD/HSP70 family sugar kinase
MNDRTALSLLLEHGALTRNRLSELSGLSKPTASQMMVRLENLGLIHVVGEVSAGRGPSAASYAVRNDKVLAVAVNINHGLAQSTVVDASGADHPIVESQLSRTARNRDPADDVRGAVRAACAASGLRMRSVRMVAVGVQGAVDERADELSFVQSLPGWPRHGARAALEAALKCQVLIENDVNLAAIAERTQGAGIGRHSFALLWVGEGLGLTVDLGGVVLNGASGRAGELGDLPVPRDVAAVDPEAKDLESLVSAAGLGRIARLHGVRKRSFPALLGALADHPEREQILDALAGRLAVVVRVVLAVVDPDRVVLGGPTAAVGGTILAELVQAKIRRSSKWSAEVVTSTVTDHPIIRGARELLTAKVREVLIEEVGDVPGGAAPTRRRLTV